MEKIDLKSVKIALERDEMLEIAGGSNCMDSFYLGATVAAYGATFGGPVGGSAGLIYFGILMLRC